MSWAASAFLIIPLLAGCAASTTPSTASTFPELKPVGELPPGFQWRFEDGPDFYVYYAERDGDRSAFAGIYFGHYPSFDPGQNPRTEPGSVAGQPVTWSLRTDESMTCRETLIPHPSLRLHAWICATNPEDAQALLSAFKNIHFTPRTPGD